MILGGPKDPITSLRTKGLKALVPPNSFGPPTMVAVVVDFKDRAGLAPPKIPKYGNTTMFHIVLPHFGHVDQENWLCVERM